MLLQNAWLHFKKIHVHRKWVRYYCRLVGIPIQGWLHDLSKYSPVEFWESIHYYQGTSSPIDAAKRDKGHSDAWLHHRGRNKHHWAYWMDDFSDGGRNILMPYKYWAEMICDFLGAGRAYYGKDFTYEKEFEWWEKEKQKGSSAMNEKLKHATSMVMEALMRQENAFWIDFWVRPEDRLDHRKKDYFILWLIYNHCVEEENNEN